MSAVPSSASPSDREPSGSTPAVPDQRFPKEERLLRRRDFVRIQSSGRTFRTRRLLIAWLPGATGRTRIGVTVSKKVGHAPTRVQVRRWIREIYRCNKALWPQNVDFVVIARRPAAEAGHAALLRDLTRWASEQPREGT